MSAPTLCPDCISGVRHEGTPTGKFEKLGGVEVYVAIPTGEYAKDKALLFLPDALGVSLNNGKADDFAANGLQTYMIDYFEGDPVPAATLGSATFDLMGWIGKHNEQVTRPLLDAVITELKGRGITEFSATGYCFGGKYVVNLAQDNVIKVGAVAHASLLQMPGDLEKLFAQSKAPLLINSCDNDQQFPAESCAIADKLLGDGKYAPGYKRVHWDGCNHGFAVRGDMNNPTVKAGKEGCFAETVTWIKKYL
ncbi:Alpha/Beta hydrolase protein [Gautieria morchelliformis]|nr:Alpha/Beta hydrolase protein [Gautieria morchelliformis]